MKIKRKINILAALIIITSVINYVFKLFPMYLLIPIVFGYILIFYFIFRNDIFAYLGNIYFALGNMKKGFDYTKKAIDFKTSDPSAYVNMGTYSLKTNKPKEALEYLEKAKSFRLDIMAEKNLMLSESTCYWLSGDIKKSIEILESMFDKFEYVNESVLTTLGYLYFLENNFEKAIEYSEKALNEKPDFSSAFDNLGQIYLKMGNRSIAYENFLKAIEHRDLPDSYYYLGVMKYEDGEKEEGLSYLEKALQCNITLLNTVTKEDIQNKINEIKSSQQV